MTTNETIKLKQIKEEILVVRLQMLVMTETEFKKALDKALKLVDELMK